MVYLPLDIKHPTITQSINQLIEVTLRYGTCVYNGLKTIGVRNQTEVSIDLCQLYCFPFSASIA